MSRRRRRLWIRISDAEFDDLRTIAVEMTTTSRDQPYTVTRIIREAVDEFVADFRERKVFDATGSEDR